MKKTTCITLAALLMACSQTLANFSGGDNFNDNSRDVSKWVEFQGSTDRSMLEANGHLEMRSSSEPVVEPAWDAGVWRWIENAGSTTQDWTITYDTVNLLDEMAMVNTEVWFGFYVAHGAVGDFENGVGIDVIKGNYGEPEHHVGSEGSIDDDGVLDEGASLTNNAVTLRMQYDAFHQRIYCSYDEGNGFHDLGSMNVQAWGMGPADEFKLYLYGGTDNTQVSSGQVYGDNFSLVPNSEYVEPEAIFGYHNFSGTDNFNDDSLNTNKWKIDHLDDGTAFDAANGRLEFTSPLVGDPEEDRSAGWLWDANSGSYTQDWTITYIAVNNINAANLPDGVENWFGLGIRPVGSLFSDWFNIDVGKEKFGGYSSYDIGSEGVSSDTGILDESVMVSSDSILMRITYQAISKTLFSSYDEGNGFQPLAQMDIEDWGMGSDDRFEALFYAGNNGMIVTSGQIYAENVILQPHADHLYESGTELASHIRDLEIYAGYDVANGTYEIEFDLWSDGTFSEVFVNAPFGTFDCEEDWEDWEYEASFPTNAVPDIDGDWEIVVLRTNGLISTTVIPFMQSDGVTPIPVVTTCPALTAPILPSNGWSFAQDVTFQWDSDFDPNANLAGIDAWNEVSDNDFEYVQYAGALPTTHSYGPVWLEGGLAEIWIFNLYEVVETNGDGIDYELGRYAYRQSDVSVIDKEWDEDLDGMSNEFEFDYFGGVTAGSPFADSDNDGCDDLSEFRGGTDPTNAVSCFKITQMANVGSAEMTLGWTSVPDRQYNVFWTSDLMSGFEPVASYLTYPQSTFVNDLHDTGYYKLDIWRNNSNPGAVKHQEIAIDGTSSDWSGLTAQLSDPAGDIDLSGADITGVTIAQGISNLFFKIDRAGVDVGEEGVSMYFDLEAGDRGVSYSMSIYMGMYGTNAVLHDKSVDSQWVEIASSWAGDVEYGFVGNSMEISVPLEPMNLIDRYGIGFYSHYSADGIWLHYGDDEDISKIVTMPY